MILTEDEIDEQLEEYEDYMKQNKENSIIKIKREEIEDETLALRIHRALEYIYSIIKENGEISQFKEDVMIIISTLLEKQLNKEELTACETTFRNQQSRIRIEKEKYMQRKIEQLEAELAKANNTINQYKEREQNIIKYLEKEIDTMGSGPSMYQVKIALKVVLEMLKGEKKNGNEISNYRNRE